MPAEAYLCQQRDRVLLSLYIQPRSSRNRIVGLHDKAVKLSITTPPVDGKANKAVISYLAKLFGLPKTALCIVQGEKSRAKLVALSNISLEKVAEIIGAQLS